MTFEELKNSLERSGAKRFHTGETVYIHPELARTERFPCVTQQMTHLAGLKCRIYGVLSNTYQLTSENEDISDWVWQDWMLLSEEEMQQYEDNTSEEFLDLL